MNVINMLKADLKRKIKKEELVFDRDQVPNDIDLDDYYPSQFKVSNGDQKSLYYEKMMPFYTLDNQLD